CAKRRKPRHDEGDTMAKKKDNEDLLEAISSALSQAERIDLLQLLGGMDYKVFPHPDDPKGPAPLVIRPRWASLETWNKADVPGVISKTSPTPLEFAVAWAKKGDWGFLADHIEASRMGNKKMRTFVAGVLRQEIKRPPRRSPTAARIFGPGSVIERARFFLLLRANGVGREAAIDMTAEKFDTDRRTIQRNLKEGEGVAIFLASLTEHALEVGTDRRYAVSDAALTPHFMS